MFVWGFFPSKSLKKTKFLQEINETQGRTEGLTSEDLLAEGSLASVGDRVTITLIEKPS